MVNKCKDAESPAMTLKDEAARQRWELFHRAIAHAKQFNNDALVDSDGASGDTEPPGPAFSVVR